MTTAVAFQKDYNIADLYMNSNFGELNNPPSSGKRRGRKPGLGSTVVQRSAANARERSRMRVLSSAFVELKGALPWVPRDTKLSKLDTLKLASGYIAYLRRILDTAPSDVDESISDTADGQSADVPTDSVEHKGNTKLFNRVSSSNITTVYRSEPATDLKMSHNDACSTRLKCSETTNILTPITQSMSSAVTPTFPFNPVFPLICPSMDLPPSTSTHTDDRNVRQKDFASETGDPVERDFSSVTSGPALTFNEQSSWVNLVFRDMLGGETDPYYIAPQTNNPGYFPLHLSCEPSKHQKQLIKQASIIHEAVQYPPIQSGTIAFTTPSMTSRIHSPSIHPKPFWTIDGFGGLDCRTMPNDVEFPHELGTDLSTSDASVQSSTDFLFSSNQMITSPMTIRSNHDRLGSTLETSYNHPYFLQA